MEEINKIEIEKALSEFRNELMDNFIILCDCNDYNELNLLTISETIDEIYDNYLSQVWKDEEE